MTPHSNSLIDFWGKINLASRPYIHDEDKAVILGSEDHYHAYKSYDDYAAKHDFDPSDSRLRRNIYQQDFSSQYPFPFLDPQFLWHPGGQYWLRQFKSYILEVSREHKLSYQDALSYISQLVAVLELVPYHSKSFGQDKLLDKLESVKKIKQFATNTLSKRAEKGEIGIICTRKAKEWEMTSSKNIVVYENKHARSARISLNSPAAEIMCRFLNIDPKEKN